MERDAQFGADQLGHPLGRPQVGPEPVLGGRLGQPPEYLLLLVGGPERSSTRVGFGREPLVPVGGVGAHPPRDGFPVDAQEGGDLGTSPTVLDTLDRQTTTGLKFRRASFASHSSRLRGDVGMNRVCYLPGSRRHQRLNFCVPKVPCTGL